MWKKQCNGNLITAKTPMSCPKVNANIFKSLLNVYVDSIQNCFWILSEVCRFGLYNLRVLCRIFAKIQVTGGGDFGNLL